MKQVLIDTKVLDQVIAAMGCVGADIVCKASHHAKKDEHDGLRPCPVAERWHKAFDELRAALAKAEPRKVEKVKRREPTIDLGKYAGTYGGYITKATP